MSLENKINIVRLRIKEAKRNKSSKLDLSNLKLSDSELNTILTIIKAELPNIESLNLKNNLLSDIPDKITSFPNLKSLNLGSNRFKGILPYYITTIKSLENLNLENNDINTIPFELGNLENLRVLNLRNNEINHKISEGVTNLTKLENLNLSENKIPKITAKISNLKRLKRFNLSENKIPELPPEIGELIELENLNLGENYLIELPAEIGNLKNIEDLSLHKNQLSELPNEMDKLTNLIYLNLGNNTFNSDVPPVLGKLHKLEYLILNENFISNITELYNLLELKYLDLNRNEILLDDEISHLINLEYLDLSESNIQSLPDGLGHLPNLQHLYLQSNYICELPDTLEYLVSLETLYLIGNELDEIPDAIKNITTLSDLVLDDNPIREETILFLMEHLENVELSFNMTAGEEESDYEEVLAKIYPDKKEEIDILINSLDASWKFENGSAICEKAKEKLRKIESGKIADPRGNLREMHEKILENSALTATKVIIEFLKNIPLSNSDFDKVYYDSAKQLIDDILDSRSSDNDKKHTLVQMASSLGNCSTPIKSLLMIKYAYKYKNTNPKPKDYETIIVREAVESEIKANLKGKKVDGELILRKTEEIEQVQGLLNAIFLEGAEMDENNKCKIVFSEGQKPDTLPSKTTHTEFAYNVVKDELAYEFSKLICETIFNGTPIKNKEGKYIGSLKKLNAIKEKYKSGTLGIISKREAAINDYSEKITEFSIKHQDFLTENYLHPRVNPMLNFIKQKEELRQLLLEVPDNEVKKTANEFLNSQKRNIENVIKDFNKESKAETKKSDSKKRLLLQSTMKDMMEQAGSVTIGMAGLEAMSVLPVGNDGKNDLPTDKNDFNSTFERPSKKARSDESQKKDSDRLSNISERYNKRRLKKKEPETETEQNNNNLRKKPKQKR